MGGWLFWYALWVVQPLHSVGQLGMRPSGILGGSSGDGDGATRSRTPSLGSKKNNVATVLFVDSGWSRTGGGGLTAQPIL
jgi:hypothetical protein